MHGCGAAAGPFGREPGAVAGGFAQTSDRLLNN